MVLTHPPQGNLPRVPEMSPSPDSKFDLVSQHLNGLQQILQDLQIGGIVSPSKLQEQAQKTCETASKIIEYLMNKKRYIDEEDSELSKWNAILSQREEEIQLREVQLQEIAAEMKGQADTLVQIEDHLSTTKSSLNDSTVHTQLLFQTSLTKQKDEIIELQSENARLLKAFHSMESTILDKMDDFDAEKSLLQQELSKLKEEHITLKKMNIQYEDQIRINEALRKDHETELVKLQNQLEVLTSERNEAIETANALAEEINESSTDDMEIESLQNEKQHLLADREKLRKDLSTQRNLTVQVERKLRDLEKASKTDEEHIRRLERDISISQKDLLHTQSLLEEREKLLSRIQSEGFVIPFASKDLTTDEMDSYTDDDQYAVDEIEANNLSQVKNGINLNHTTPNITPNTTPKRMNIEDSLFIANRQLKKLQTRISVLESDNCALSDDLASEKINRLYLESENTTQKEQSLRPSRDEDADMVYNSQSSTRSIPTNDQQETLERLTSEITQCHQEIKNLQEKLAKESRHKHLLRDKVLDKTNGTTQIRNTQNRLDFNGADEHDIFHTSYPDKLLDQEDFQNRLSISQRKIQNLEAELREQDSVSKTLYEALETAYSEIHALQNIPTVTAADSSAKETVKLSTVTMLQKQIASLREIGEERREKLRLLSDERDDVLLTCSTLQSEVDILKSRLDHAQQERSDVYFDLSSQISKLEMVIAEKDIEHEKIMDQYVDLENDYTSLHRKFTFTQTSSNTTQNLQNAPQNASQDVPHTHTRQNQLSWDADRLPIVQQTVRSTNYQQSMTQRNEEFTNHDQSRPSIHPYPPQTEEKTPTHVHDDLVKLETELENSQNQVRLLQRKLQDIEDLLLKEQSRTHSTANTLEQLHKNLKQKDDELLALRQLLNSKTSYERESGANTSADTDLSNILPQTPSQQSVSDGDLRRKLMEAEEFYLEAKKSQEKTNLLYIQAEHDAKKIREEAYQSGIEKARMDALQFLRAEATSTFSQDLARVKKEFQVKEVQYQADIQRGLTEKRGLVDLLKALSDNQISILYDGKIGHLLRLLEETFLEVFPSISFSTSTIKQGQPNHNSTTFAEQTVVVSPAILQKQNSLLRELLSLIEESLLNHPKSVAILKDILLHDFSLSSSFNGDIESYQLEFCLHSLSNKIIDLSLALQTSKTNISQLSETISSQLKTISEYEYLHQQDCHEVETLQQQVQQLRSLLQTKEDDLGEELSKWWKNVKDKMKLYHDQSKARLQKRENEAIQIINQSKKQKEELQRTMESLETTKSDLKSLQMDLMLQSEKIQTDMSRIDRETVKIENANVDRVKFEAEKREWEARRAKETEAFLSEKEDMLQKLLRAQEDQVVRESEWRVGFTRIEANLLAEKSRLQNELVLVEERKKSIEHANQINLTRANVVSMELQEKKIELERSLVQTNQIQEECVQLKAELAKERERLVLMTQNSSEIDALKSDLEKEFAALRRERLNVKQEKDENGQLLEDLQRKQENLDQLTIKLRDQLKKLQQKETNVQRLMEETEDIIELRTRQYCEEYAMVKDLQIQEYLNSHSSSLPSSNQQQSDK